MRSGRGRCGAVAALAGAATLVPSPALAAPAASGAAVVHESIARLASQPYRAEFRFVTRVTLRGGSPAARRGFPARGIRGGFVGSITAESERRTVRTISGLASGSALTMLSYDGAHYVSHDGQRYYLVIGELRRFVAAVEAQTGALTAAGRAGVRPFAGLRALPPRVVDGVAHPHYGGRLVPGRASPRLSSLLSALDDAPAELRTLIAAAARSLRGRHDYWLSAAGVLVRQTGAFVAGLDIGALARRAGDPDASALRGVRLVVQGAYAFQVVELGRPITVGRPSPVGTVAAPEDLGIGAERLDAIAGADSRETESG